MTMYALIYGIVHRLKREWVATYWGWHTVAKWYRWWRYWHFSQPPISPNKLTLSSTLVLSFSLWSLFDKPLHFQEGVWSRYLNSTSFQPVYGYVFGLYILACQPLMTVQLECLVNNLKRQIVLRTGMCECVCVWGRGLHLQLYTCII